MSGSSETIPLTTIVVTIVFTIVMLIAQAYIVVLINNIIKLL